MQTPKNSFGKERQNNTSPLREQITSLFLLSLSLGETIAKSVGCFKGMSQRILIKKHKNQKIQDVSSFYLFLLREEFFRIERLIEVSFSKRLRAFG